MTEKDEPVNLPYYSEQYEFLEEITEFTMISDDIIYVGLLLVSIAFGKITRQIPNTPVRKWTSSLFGLGKVFVFFVAW